MAFYKAIGSKDIKTRVFHLFLALAMFLAAIPAALFIMPQRAEAAVTYVGNGPAVMVGSGNLNNIPVPSGIQNNDILIVVLHSRDNVNSTMPAGWTNVVEGNGNTANRLEVWWKRTAGTETAPTVAHSGGNAAIARMHAFRGAVNAGSPFDVVGTVQSNADSPINTAPITTTTSGDMILHLFGSQDDNNWGNFTGIPNTLAAQNAYDPGILYADNSLALTYGIQATAGSTGAAGAAQTANGPDAGVSVQMAIRPGITTLGSGTDPVANTIGPGAAETDVNAFTLQTNSGTMFYVGNGSAVMVGSGNLNNIPVPSGIQNNDILIVVLHSRDNVNSTMPAGWTNVVEGNGNTANRLEVWWKRTAGTETAPTVAHSGGNAAIARMHAFRGAVNAGSPFDVVGTVQSNADSPINTAPITTTTSGDMILHLFGSQDDNNWGNFTGIPNTLAAQNAYDPGILYADNSLALTYGIQATAGSTGAAGAAQTANGPDAGVSVQMALKPAIIETTESITSVTINLSSGSGIQTLKITDSLNNSLGFINSPAAGSNTISVSITATTTQASYKVRIIPLSHSNMPAPPGGSYAVTAPVTSWTSAPTTPYIHTGTDANINPLTIDNLSPGNAAGLIATPGDTQASLSWTNPTDSDFSNVLILRNTSSISNIPSEGSSPAVDSLIGTSIVRYTGSASPFTDTGLINGTTYFYRVFAKDIRGNYSPTGVEVSVTPVAPVADYFIISPDYSDTGARGTTKTYTHTIESYSVEARTVNLAKSDSLAADGWTSVIRDASDTQDIASIDIPAYPGSVSFIVKVNIPADAPGGATNITTVTGSWGYDDFIDIATDITTVEDSAAMLILSVYNPATSSYQVYDPGNPQILVMDFGGIMPAQEYTIGDTTGVPYAVKLEVSVSGSTFDIASTSSDFISYDSPIKYISIARLMFAKDQVPNASNDGNWTSFSSLGNTIYTNQPAGQGIPYYFDYRLKLEWDDEASEEFYSTDITYTVTTTT